ncbi:hypothetical protein [Streptomyces mirabilis]|uniref:hypothetical protein n=1 Tax=Streptomyces mirabilis TaxID=68239 RepID=UPI0033A95E8A
MPPRTRLSGTNLTGPPPTTESMASRRRLTSPNTSAATASAPKTDHTTHGRDAQFGTAFVA